MTPPSAGKAIEGLAPELPAKEAARWTLHVRLRAVERLLDEAGAGATDEKAVHRLRVSTRRAAAALRAYEVWTPKKRRRRVLKALKRVRRTAAEARLCDVQIATFQRLMQESNPALAGALGVVVGRLAEKRSAATRAVRALADNRNHGRAALKRLRKKLVRDTGDGDRELTLLDLASTQIPAMARRMEEAASDGLEDIENVHRLRIAGKRMRYGVELFDACFPSDVYDELIDRLTRFQDQLGAINDLSDMIARVEEFSEDEALDPRVREALALLSRQLRVRLDAAHLAFVEWWRHRALASLFEGLSVPGVSGAGAGDAPLPAPGERAARNGDLGAAVDQLIEDAVRHLA